MKTINHNDDSPERGVDEEPAVSIIETVTLTTDEIERVDFSNKVKKIVFSSSGQISFLDATLYAAEYFMINPDEIMKYITSEIKQRIELEALDDHLIRNTDNNKFHQGSKTGISAFFE